MDTDQTSKPNTEAVLTEVPEVLKKLTLSLVKTFFGLEYYVVIDYIQRNTVVREDQLRDLVKIETRQLRQLLAVLKVNKFIKERLIIEEGPKKTKSTYYFVNYKAVLNVTKYKVDHMRQKLEVREKDDINKASYRCSNELCRKHYDAMDIGKIYDPFTQEMKCWQCRGLVTADETSGPSQETRSSMAKFNEQMAVLFSMLKNVDGVRFSREILEPTIATASTEPKEEEKVFKQVGQRAFSTAGKTRTELYGSGITVSIGGSVEIAPEAKPAVPWLQERDFAQQIPTTSSAYLNAQPTVMEEYKNPLDGLEDYDADGTKMEPDFKRPRAEDVVVSSRREDIANLLMEEEAAFVPPAPAEEKPPESEGERETEPVEDGIEDDDEEYVLVSGKRVHVDDITEELVAQMSETEKADYIRKATVDDEFY